MKRILQGCIINKLTISLVIFLISTIAISYLSTKLPDKYYSYKHWIFKERNWEKQGRFYQKVFKVKLWKHRVPELADFIKTVFPKKFISEFNSEFLSKYLIESCKAELTHWCIIFSSALFLVYADTSTFIFMFLLASMFNIPFIIIQRYNRPRIIWILKQKGMII